MKLYSTAHGVKGCHATSMRTCGGRRNRCRTVSQRLRSATQATDKTLPTVSRARHSGPDRPPSASGNRWPICPVDRSAKGASRPRTEESRARIACPWHRPTQSCRRSIRLGLRASTRRGTMSQVGLVACGVAGFARHRAAVRLLDSYSSRGQATMTVVGCLDDVSPPGARTRSPPTPLRS